MPKHRMRVRRFLDRRGHSGGEYVLATVPDTSRVRGSYFDDDVVFELADGDGHVRLDFPLRSEPARRNSLAKARLLADICARFADAVEAESEVAREREVEREAAQGEARLGRRGLVDWMVHVTTVRPIEGWTEDHVEDLADALLPHSAAVGVTGQRVSATLTVWAACRRDAPLLGEEMFRLALATIGFPQVGALQSTVER